MKIQLFPVRDDERVSAQLWFFAGPAVKLSQAGMLIHVGRSGNDNTA